MNDISSNAAPIRVDVIDPRSSEATSAMGEYFAELAERFPEGFDPGDTLTEDAEFFESPRGAFLVVRESVSSDLVVGCGAVRLLASDAAEIKRMWISAACRGRGLGRVLLETLETQAVALGARVVRLDTNSVLLEAIAMYEKSGYQQIERYNDNPFAQRWFEKQLGSAD